MQFFIRKPLNLFQTLKKEEIIYIIMPVTPHTWPQCIGPIHWCSGRIEPGHQLIAKCGCCPMAWTITGECDSRRWAIGCNSAPPWLVVFALGTLRRGLLCYSLICGSWRASLMLAVRWASGFANSLHGAF